MILPEFLGIIEIVKDLELKILKLLCKTTKILVMRRNKRFYQTKYDLMKQRRVSFGILRKYN